MREASTDLVVRVDPSWNITDLVLRTATNRPNRVVFSERVDGHLVDVTAKAFRDRAVALAKGLIAAGIEPGDRVAIMSRTRFEWTLFDVAIWFAGAVTVPVYETSSAAQAYWNLSDAEATAILVETSELADCVRQGFADTPDATPRIWNLADGDLDRLVEQGAGVSEEEVEARRVTAGLDDLATIIYTSGTTGRPKGVELTHGNFVVLSENAAAVLEDVVGQDRSSTVLFLPLAHVFARFIQMLCLACGARITHCSDPADLVDTMAEAQPTFLLSVPRVFEKIYNSAEAKAVAAGKGKLFARATNVAIDYSKALDRGRIPLGLRAQHALFDRLVYPKLRAVFGGRIEYVVSGGGPLGERLGHFYRGAGIKVLEGYGLTESTAPTSVNMPALTKIGTVGKQLPGNSVRIAEDGEILLRGPHMSRGYWKNPAATADTWIDGEGPQSGWFRTGDLGSIDADGYLRITGRSKEILVTAGGKNVAPAQLEDSLRAHPLISQCIVVGDAKPFVGVLITLDDEMLPSWLANEGLPELTVAQAAEHPQVRAALQAAIDQTNTLVSRAESIRRFEVLPIDFTIASGHLTPSMKLKRNIVMDDFAAEVDHLYSS